MAKIDQIRGQIERNWKFDDQLKVQMHKLETKDQDASFTHCPSPSLTVLDDRVSTFDELIVEF